ncbi:MAG: acetate--CoA ligase family protein [Elusimicrobiales bacterium]|nr:acetate--CoA ligase family protein [Elusimicrobiales bacterium]
MTDFKAIERIFDKAGSEGRKALSEPETYQVLAAAGLNVPMLKICPAPISDEEAEAAAKEISDKFPGDKAVIKLVSSKTLHKTESGGVKVCGNNSEEIKTAIMKMSEKFPEAEAFMAVEFIPHSPFGLGEELLLGARADDAFGPVITLGPGGTHAESFMKVLAKGIAPSVLPALLADEKAFEKLISASWIWNYCSGNVRGGKRLAADAEIKKWLAAFAEIMEYFRDNGKSAWAISEFEINPLCIANGRITALDGVLRFRPAKDKARNKPSKGGVQAILSPKAVAVIGVSEKKMNMGRIILNNVIKVGFPKEHIYVIKPGINEIDGVKCVPSPKDLPEKADMYVVAVPSSTAADVLKEAGNSGKVNGIVLISGGLGEKSGSENAAQHVIDMIAGGRAKNPDFAMSGANSMGIVLNKAKVNTFFIPEYKLEHPIGLNPNIAPTAFVSQSGAFVIAAESTMPWLKPLYSITVGNQQDITVVDYLDSLADDDEIKVMLVYMEGFKPGDGIALAKILRRARANGKQIVIYKAGRTAFGQKAVMGHTASIAGDYLVTDMILSQNGALVAQNFEEFYDFSMLACHFAKYGKIGRNTFLMSNAGFEAVGMADNFTKSINVAFPDDSQLKAELQQVLAEAKLDGLVDVRNPFDVTPMAPDRAWAEILKRIIPHKGFDAAIVSNVPLSGSVQTLPAGEGHKENYEKGSFICNAAEAARQAGKPLLFCVDSGRLYDPYCDYAAKLGLPVFRTADRAVKMYIRYLDYVNETL